MEQKGYAVKKAVQKKENIAEDLADIQDTQKKIAETLDTISNMPGTVHGLINENWELKKVIYRMKKEKIAYHKNMDEIEIGIDDIRKKRDELRGAIRKVIESDIRKHPLKKYRAYKELLTLYFAG